MPGPSFTIRPLNATDLAAASRICARAMLDNPVHVKVFGQQRQLRQQRLQRFFPALLTYVLRKGELHGTFNGHELIGVLGMLPPGHCQPRLTDIMRMLPALLTANSLPGLLRTARWLLLWARLDPEQPHWHMGPLAVDPDWQGRGAGHLLMNFTMERGKQDLLYLETDTPENVRLYESIGFAVSREVELMGVKSWLMIQEPVCAAQT